MSDEPKAPRGRAAKLIPIASALIVAATPGVYSAWQGAKQAWTQRQEQRLRDAQETDLQRAVQAHTEAIRAIKESMVTHRDLVDLVIKLRAATPAPDPAARPRPRPPRNAPPEPATAALLAEIAKLRVSARTGDKARDKATKALRTMPALKPPAEARAIQQQAQAAP